MRKSEFYENAHIFPYSAWMGYIWDICITSKYMCLWTTFLVWYYKQLDWPWDLRLIVWGDFFIFVFHFLWSPSVSKLRSHLRGEGRLFLQHSLGNFLNNRVMFSRVANKKCDITQKKSITLFLFLAVGIIVSHFYNGCVELCITIACPK